MQCLWISYLIKLWPCLIYVSNFNNNIFHIYVIVFYVLAKVKLVTLFQELCLKSWKQCSNIQSTTSPPVKFHWEISHKHHKQPNMCTVMFWPWQWRSGRTMSRLLLSSWARIMSSFISSERGKWSAHRSWWCWSVRYQWWADFVNISLAVWMLICPW